MIRVLAVDVDGTLLDSSHALRADVRDALELLSLSGVAIVLATARGPMALNDIVHKLRFAPLLICFSGAWIGKWDAESSTVISVRLDKRLSASAARFILATALAHRIEPSVYTPETWRVRTMTTEIFAESRIVNFSPLIAPDLLSADEELSKILLITSAGEPARALRTIAHSVRPFSTATFSKSNYLEIIAPGVNKAKAVAELARTLGVNLSQVAAVGDGDNDVEMLEEVGLGIAMGNACDAAKAAAGWVTGTNDEGGVAQAVRRLMVTGMVGV
jgi:Cof subfamily protein (haloacid dehalogenase superfamily)